MVKLIALDLDGTLLDSNKEITKENYEILKLMHERGAEIVPATGRIWHSIPEVVLNLDFIRYVIAVNGADVREIRKDECIYSRTIPNETALKLLEYYDTLKYPYYVYAGNEAFITQSMFAEAETELHDRPYVELLKRVCSPVPELKAYLRETGKDIQKAVLVLNNGPLRERLLSNISTMFPGLNPTSSYFYNVEVNAVGADKGIGINKLAEHLGIDIKDTMSFGDGLNDVSMLKAAGMGVAMAHAEDRVKECADYITLTNDESGVAYALRKLAL